MSNNLLSGHLPESVGNLSSSLEGFYALNCDIDGKIPQGFGNLSGLIVLGLAGNQLTGSIPETFKNLQQIQVLLFGIRCSKRQQDAASGQLKTEQFGQWMRADSNVSPRRILKSAFTIHNGPFTRPDVQHSPHSHSDSPDFHNGSSAQQPSKPSPSHIPQLTSESAGQSGKLQINNNSAQKNSPQDNPQMLPSLYTLNSSPTPQNLPYPAITDIIPKTYDNITAFKPINNLTQPHLESSQIELPKAVINETSQTSITKNTDPPKQPIAQIDPQQKFSESPKQHSYHDHNISPMELNFPHQECPQTMSDDLVNIPILTELTQHPLLNIQQQATAAVSQPKRQGKWKKKQCTDEARMNGRNPSYPRVSPNRIVMQNMIDGEVHDARFPHQSSGGESRNATSSIDGRTTEKLEFSSNLER